VETTYMANKIVLNCLEELTSKTWHLNVGVVP
jgi:hypothetical protein